MERSILIHMKSKHPKDATVYMIDAMSSDDRVNSWSSLGMISRFEVYADCKSLYPHIKMSLPALTVKKVKKPKLEESDMVFFIPCVLLDEGNEPVHLSSALIGSGKKSRSKKISDNINPVGYISKCSLVIDSQLKEISTQITKYEPPNAALNGNNLPDWVDVDLIKL